MSRAETAMSHVDDVLRDEAAHWFVLLASGEASVEEQRAWQSWRATSATHEAAWQLAESAVARFAAVPKTLAATSFALLDEHGRRRRRHAKQMLLGITLFCGLGISALLTYRLSLQMDWTADAVTAIGEQRTLTLADGSTLVLDTDSAVDINFSSTQREIHLRRGQIFIATAADPAARHRDFIVSTQEGRTRALGTRFTVQQETDTTRVAVLEARVAIKPLRAEGPENLLAASESLRFDKHHVLMSEAARPQDDAWARGFLLADNMRLADFAAQLGRYRSTPLSCAPAVCELRISGAFPLNDTDRVLAALPRTLPVVVMQKGEEGSVIAAQQQNTHQEGMKAR